jgi:anti-sigma regulatory factor (Ser/Thr protein kinase)
VARARRMSAAALRSWGMDGDVPAIELAVSELVAHAVRDGDGPAEMRLSADGDTIRLEVTDLGGRSAKQTERTERTERNGERHGEKTLEPRHELGLWFVDEVADDWGVDRRPGRTRVWLVRHRADGHRPDGQPSGIHPD